MSKTVQYSFDKSWTNANAFEITLSYHWFSHIPHFVFILTKWIKYGRNYAWIAITTCSMYIHWPFHMIWYIYIESSWVFLSLTDHKSIFVIIIAPPFFINNNKMVYVIRYLQHLCFHYDITGSLSNELDTLSLYWNNLLKKVDK